MGLIFEYYEWICRFIWLYSWHFHVHGDGIHRNFIFRVTAIKLFCKKNPDHEQSRNTIITGEVLGSSTEVKYCLNKGPDEYHISPQSADQFITGAEGVFFAGEGAISFYPICDIPDEGTRNVAVDSTKCKPQ